MVIAPDFFSSITGVMFILLILGAGTLGSRGGIVVLSAVFSLTFFGSFGCLMLYCKICCLDGGQCGSCHWQAWFPYVWSGGSLKLAQLQQVSNNNLHL